MNKVLIGALFDETTKDWVAKFLGLYKWSGGGENIVSFPSILHNDSLDIVYNFPWENLIQYHLKGTFRFYAQADRISDFINWINVNECDGPYFNGELDEAIKALSLYDVTRRQY